MLPRPVVVVNVKTYPQATGEGARRLAVAMAQVAEETGAGMAIAVQAADIRLVADAGIPVFAQHVDPVLPGNTTGAVTVDAIVGAGAGGSLVNHSERRLTLADMSACVAALRARELVSILCTHDAAASGAGATLGPTFVAVEPPELIGGDVSVTSADPKVVSAARDAVRRVDPKVRLLCGAGVKNGSDVVAALELGADGVLVASGVAKAKKPDVVLRDLVSKV